MIWRSCIYLYINMPVAVRTETIYILNVYNFINIYPMEVRRFSLFLFYNF